MRVIGAADEFWRMRLTRVDSSDIDFEWHDDILYREPVVRTADEVETWHVEAVRLDDVDAIVRIASFDDRSSAEEYLDRASEDLTEMTKAQFEDAYLGEGPTTADAKGGDL